MTATLALFGGTFDPPHVGHLIVARDVAEHLGVETLWLVPARVPPHKGPEDATPPELRLEMCRAAVEGDPVLDVSDAELRREGPSYTVETLRRFREEHPDEALVFVMGADQVRAFRDWKEPGEIARLAHLAVMARGGEEAAGAELGVEADVTIVPVTRVDVSSTAVRERVREGRSVRYLVPDAVRRIIEREGLYKDPC